MKSIASGLCTVKLPLLIIQNMDVLPLLSFLLLGSRREIIEGGASVGFLLYR